MIRPMHEEPFLPAEPAESGVAANNPFRILVCEDNPMNQKVIRLMLEYLGYSSDLARNGEEALATLAMNPYDLIFMDCQMPVMDGYEATRRIRASASLSANVVIAMTAHAMMGDREKCLAAGMDDYISKPIARDLLETLLVKWSGLISKGGRQGDP
ncbi:MAG: multi-sensor Hybrid histidine kinase [Fibrobacteres bacterium]|nr:multi-sensor Hybrid histidine kinase [Fibrobacterota bacterium]